MACLLFTRSVASQAQRRADAVKAKVAPNAASAAAVTSPEAYCLLQETTAVTQTLPQQATASSANATADADEEEEEEETVEFELKLDMTLEQFQQGGPEAEVTGV